MKNKKIAESLVAIIIGIFILSFAIFGIISIITYNKDVSNFYENEIFKYMIEANTKNIIKKINTDNINTNETFYLYKNPATKTYDVLTGTINEEYKFIDSLGNKIDPNNNIGRTYIREFSKEVDILRHTLSPTDIQNLIFHFDSTNIDGTNNSSLTKGDYIDTWNDLSGNGLNAIELSDDKRPIYNIDAIEDKAIVVFDGGNDLLTITNNDLINTGTEYKEKTFALVIKTGFDIDTERFIYEQGGTDIGYSISINNKNLYLNAYNYNDWDSGEEIKSINLGGIIENTIYSIIITQNSNYNEDNKNLYKVYINGTLLGTLDHIDLQTAHSDEIGIGGIYGDSHNNNSSISCNECKWYKGNIMEIISWNHGLTNNEVQGIQNYFINKWLRGNESIKYNTINIKIKKYNNY